MSSPPRPITPAETLARLLVEQEIATPDGIEGCTEDDLRALETHHGRALPRAYADFLRSMGRSMGELFAESEILCGPHLFALRDRAAAMMQSPDRAAPLPDDALVFAAHGDEAFDFFRAGEGDDPPVYQYLASAAAWQRIAPSFNQYLKSAVADHLAIVRDWASEEAVEARAQADPGSSALFWALLVILIALFFAIAIFGDEVSRALFG